MSEFITKMAIANRGEVAVRIIRACEELGISSVLLHSEVDVDTLAYRLAKETVCIGPAEASASYLNIEKNIAGALSAGVQALHPGFGFLSENPAFAKACKTNRIIFVGPSAESIELFGDKITAKKLVAEVGCPIIPGYGGENQNLSELVKQCDLIGYPLMVKAANGGGGRGLRIIAANDSAESAIISAQREGLSSFGSDVVFLEKYLGRAKHIEIQIFGAASGEVFHLYERECTIQRRHQKVVEEAPSAKLDEDLLKSMTDFAVKIAKKAKYIGAGTVEFLVQDGKFYFLEMNTRLQVEHPVTELTMAVDLVKNQILTAQGDTVQWSQATLRPQGHAIECRIYAEDPFENGMPSTGRLGACFFPAGPGRRFEIGFEEGDEITSYYDAMIAKLVVWDETRFRAIQKLLVVLKDIVIFGVHTNIPYLVQILNHSEFLEGTMTTQFIASHFPEGLKKVGFNSTDQVVIKEIENIGLNGKMLAVAKHPSPWIGAWGGGS